jgi:hypothetical protein
MTASARRNDSLWRPLLIWLGPVLALTNAAFIPLVALTISIEFIGFLGTGNQPPDPRKAWLPLLWGLDQAALVLVLVQAMLATLCLTWGPGIFWRLLLTHWLVVTAAGVAFLLGFPVLWFAMVVINVTSGDAWHTHLSSEYWRWENPNLRRDAEQLLAILSTFPMLFLGLQAPFWALRLLLGSRLERPVTNVEQPVASAPPQPLSIMDLMLATAICAASLALLQFSDRVFAADGNQALSYLVNVMIVSAVGLAISLVTGIPLTLLFLSRFSLAFAWGLALALAGGITVIVFGVAYCFVPIPKPGEGFAQICLFAYVYVAGYGAGLTVLRRNGWRLARRARMVPHG